MTNGRRRSGLAPLHVFLGRFLASVAVVGLMVTASLAVGMWGYETYEGMDHVDAFANAAMILSGMGPLQALHSQEAKLFAGGYALYSGLFVVVAAGLILAPVLHRLLHWFHLDDTGAD